MRPITLLLSVVLLVSGCSFTTTPRVSTEVPAAKSAVDPNAPAGPNNPAPPPPLKNYAGASGE